MVTEINGVSQHVKGEKTYSKEDLLYSGMTLDDASKILSVFQAADVDGNKVLSVDEIDNYNRLNSVKENSYQELDIENTDLSDKTKLLKTIEEKKEKQKQLEELYIYTKNEGKICSWGGGGLTGLGAWALLAVGFELAPLISLACATGVALFFGGGQKLMTKDKLNEIEKEIKNLQDEIATLEQKAGRM